MGRWLANIKGIDMMSEHDYRQLLKKAQDSIDEIGNFVRAMEVAPHVDTRTRELSGAATAALRELDRLIEQLWDHFKRLPPG